MSNNSVEVFEAIDSRRSIKAFDSDYKLTADQEKQLFSAARRSPTAFNSQNWRFVIVKDQELREKIKAVSWEQSQVADASILVILCADLKAWDKDPARYWRNANQEVQDFMVGAIKGYYEGQEQVQRDEAMRSCGIAAQTLMLAAKALDLDSCPMDGFDFDAVGKLINLPEDHVISMFVAIGKAAEPARPRGGDVPEEEIFIKDTF